MDVCALTYMSDSGLWQNHRDKYPARVFRIMMSKEQATAQGTKGNIQTGMENMMSNAGEAPSHHARHR